MFIIGKKNERGNLFFIVGSDCEGEGIKKAEKDVLEQ